MHVSLGAPRNGRQTYGSGSSGQPVPPPTLIQEQPQRPPQHRRIPRPPIPRLPLSLRQRLCGRRSLFFIGLMLLRVIWVSLDTIRKVRDPSQAVIAGGIFVLALVIASPERHLRAPAVGVMCALIWSYALSGAETLDTPALQGWPILVLLALVAGSVELAFSYVARLIEAHHEATETPAAPWISWAMIALQTIGAWLFVMPIAFVALLDLTTYGLGGHAVFDLVPMAVSLPPVVGVGIYMGFIIKRMRSIGLEPHQV
ncbi:MAG: hypothetical protein AB7P40_26460 [Chloroflexota bacterium]